MKTLLRLLCRIGIHDWRVYVGKGAITTIAMHPVCARCRKPKNCDPIITPGFDGPVQGLDGRITSPGKRPEYYPPELWN